MAQSKDPRSVRTITAKDGTEWVARWVDGHGIDRSAWPGLRVADRTVEFTGPDGRTLTGLLRDAESTDDKALRSALKKALAGVPSEPRGQTGGGWSGGAR